MPLVRQEGKDTIIFASKEDHATPSKIELPEPEPSPGILLPNGEINWNCPCLGGMAIGPCGLEFREAFSCFHYSNAEPKGSDCYDAFKTMQMCMAQYPALYGNKDSALDDLDDDLNTVDDDNNKHASVESTDKRKQVSEMESQLEAKTEPAASSTEKNIEKNDAK